MSTVSGIFTFALPDDISSDKLRIYVSSTEEGTYTLDTTFNYTYGYRTQEYDSIDTTKWYKIQFYNSTDDEAGPKSNPIYGGDFGTRDTPFLALSSSFDGAYYASATDVYDRTGLTTSNISVAKIQAILRSTRAYIDMILDEANPAKYRRFWSTSTSRRKYNALLRLIKDLEINLTASVIYKGFADDIPMSISSDSRAESIKIGSTSISYSTSGASSKSLMEISDRYFEAAKATLNLIRPSSIPLSYSDNWEKGPLFMMPYEARGNIYNTIGNTGDTFTQYTADLTGLGDDINGVSFSLNNNCVVEGVASQNVDPLEAQSSIVDAELYVNGVLYHLDDWVDNGGTTQAGKDGTTGGTDGFSVDFSTSTEYIDLKWNNTAANGGFDTDSDDEILFKYWVLGNS